MIESEKNVKIKPHATSFTILQGFGGVRGGVGVLEVQSREYYLYKELPWYLDQRRMFLSFLMRID